jgi:hypothetical protein
MPARRAVQSRSLKVRFEPKPKPCTKCRAPMVLARIEPAKPGFDLRTFECSKCNNADQYIIEYGTNTAWALHVRERYDN